MAAVAAVAWQARIQNAAAAQAESFWSTSQQLLNDNMPSVRSLSAFALSALGSAQTVLGSSGALRYTSPIARQNQQGNSAMCSTTGPLSCQNTTAQSNLCCFNAPGGALLQTQFWDTNPPTGPSNSWTIHGLWVCRQ